MSGIFELSISIKVKLFFSDFLLTFAFYHVSKAYIHEDWMYVPFVVHAGSIKSSRLEDIHILTLKSISDNLEIKFRLIFN